MKTLNFEKSHNVSPTLKGVAKSNAFHLSEDSLIQHHQNNLQSNNNVSIESYKKNQRSYTIGITPPANNIINNKNNNNKKVSTSHHTNTSGSSSSCCSSSRSSLSKNNNNNNTSAIGVVLPVQVQSTTNIPLYEHGETLSQADIIETEYQQSSVNTKYSSNNQYQKQPVISTSISTSKSSKRKRETGNIIMKYV